MVFFLLSKPLDLKDYRVYEEYVLQQFLPHSRLKFKQASLYWDSEKLAFTLKAHGIKIKSKTSMSKLIIPDLLLHFPVYRILLLKFHPTLIRIKSPNIDLHDSFEEEVTEENQDEANNVEFSDILQNLTEATSIGKIIISNARIQIRTTDYGHWDFRNINVGLQRVGETVESAFSLRVKNIGRFSGILYTKEGKFQKLKIALRDFKGETILNQPDLTNISFVREVTPYLSKLTMPITGVLTFYLTETFDFQKMNFHLHFGAGEFIYPPFYPTALPIGSIACRGDVTHDRIQFDEVELDFAYGKARLGGLITLNPSLKNLKSLTFNMKAQAENLDFKHTSLLWPVGLALAPREWVVHNIPSGQVPLLTAEAQGRYSLETQTVELQKLQGEIHPENAIVSYLEGLKPVIGVKAAITYDKDTMTIKLLEGHTHNQKITDGTIIIKDLQKDDQWIDIALNVEGSVSDALKIIDVPRLRYGAKYGLSPQQTKGMSKTALTFSFPLEQATTLEKVDFVVQSQLTDVYIKDVLKILPVTLTKGALSLNLRKAGMIVQGQALLNKSPSHIQWEENFQESKSSWQSKLTVKSFFSLEVFKEMGLSFEKYFSGKSPIELQLTTTSARKGVLTAMMDIHKSSIHLPTLKVFKPSGQPGKIKLEAELENGKFSAIKELRIEAGSHLKFIGNAFFDPRLGHLTELKIVNFQTTQGTYSGFLLRGQDSVYRLRLNGDYLDLTNFIENRDDIEESFLSKIPYQADIQINRTEVKNTPFLEDMKATLEQSSKGVIEKLNVTAHLPTKKQNRQKKSLHIQISKDGDYQNLSLKIDNIGQLISLLSATTDLKGGEAIITGKRSFQGTVGAWEGTYRIKDFEILNAPVLARLLKVASPFAFIEIFSKEKGLRFSDFQGGFILKPESLYLKKSRGAGPSIGMTLEGLIDRKKETLNLRGTLIPAYILNSFMSYIPIIGQLFGGMGEGLWAIAFTIRGTQNNPQITANLLSAITPGFLRKLFEAPLKE